MKENLTLRDIIDMLVYDTEYVVYGARTGKKLFNKHNTDKVKERYLDTEIFSLEGKFGVEIQTYKVGNISYAKPMITIWLTGF